MSVIEQPVVFVVPGDLHLTESGRDNHRAALAVIDEINRLVQPDFVQFIGDNVQDATPGQFRLFKDVAAGLQAPCFVLAGDHDIEPRADDADAFRAFLGEPTGTTCLAGHRFIRLNTVERRPKGMSPGQLAWFREQVDEAAQQQQRVVVFQHHYPYKVFEEFAGPGIDDWRVTVQTRRIAAVFTGHTHYGQIANDGRNVTIASRSIGDPEGGAPGYTIAYSQGDQLAVTYRTIVDRGPVVLIVQPREKLLALDSRHIVTGADRIAVRGWSQFPIVEARVRIDETAWLELEPAAGGLWTRALDGAALEKGPHFLEAQLRDAKGNEGGQTIDFVVDHTGRYTAVPAVRPIVHGTAFC
jgi:Icc protein